MEAAKMKSASRCLISSGGVLDGGETFQVHSSKTRDAHAASIVKDSIALPSDPKVSIRSQNNGTTDTSASSVSLASDVDDNHHINSPSLDGRERASEENTAKCSADCVLPNNLSKMEETGQNGAGIQPKEKEQTITAPWSNRNEQTITARWSNRNIAAFTPSLSSKDESGGETRNRRRSILRQSDVEGALIQRRNPKRGRVNFSKVQIRRYPMILSDNPACPAGPPLGLGWEYEVLPGINVGDFESFRLRSRRFQTSHLVLSHYKRLEILQRLGCEAAEIDRMEREMGKIRRQRKMTMVFAPFVKIEIACQSLGRKVRKAFCCRSRNK